MSNQKVKDEVMKLYTETARDISKWWLRNAEQRHGHLPAIRELVEVMNPKPDPAPAPVPSAPPSQEKNAEEPTSPEPRKESLLPKIALATSLGTLGLVGYSYLYPKEDKTVIQQPEGPASIYQYLEDRNLHLPE